MSLGGGILAMNASASLELETPGAFARLIGRGDSRSHEELGVFVADADAVKIKARSPAGVILTADTRAGVESEAGDIGTTTGVNVEDSTNGSRVEVSASALFGSIAFTSKGPVLGRTGETIKQGESGCVTPRACVVVFET